MSITDSAGNILTKSELLAKATQVTQPTVYKFTEDIFETFGYPGAKEPEGGRRLLFNEGREITEPEIDAMYAASAATFGSIAPNHGPAAGNTAVTITGTGLLGVEGVTIGGSAATDVDVVSDTKVTCKTPAHAAGAVSVVLKDASGDVTANNAYTYDA
jgi:hypothetical protein